MLPTLNYPSRSALASAAFSIFLMVTAYQPSHAQLVDSIRNFFRDPLLAAIDKGLAPGGDLAWELTQLEDAPIHSKAHGEAVLRALDSLSTRDHGQTESWNTVQYEVVNLFRNVDDIDSPAYEILWRRGIPELARLYEQGRDNIQQDIRNARPLNSESMDDVVTMLEVLAAFGTREGTDCVLEAVRSNFLQSNYQWHAVLSNYVYHDFGIKHPQAERLFEELSRQLPESESIAAAFLEAANSAAFADEEFIHPFSSPAGLAQLKQWLTPEYDGDVDIERALSATVALAFLDPPAQGLLLELADRHPKSQVRTQAAWAAAHAGLESGFTRLAELCMDVHCSSLAIFYLEDFEREDLIPAGIDEPQFAAKAEFSEWLQNENELGHPPQELEIIDQRELNWFDSDTPTLFTLLRYRSAGETVLDEDETGVGIVGSMTWSFFSEHMDQLPAEDVYAIHYVFEAVNAELIKEVDQPDVQFTGEWLEQWTLGPLEEITFETAHWFNDALGYPQPNAAVAKALQAGHAGFAVFDAERSRWYSATEFPEGISPSSVLRAHVGRQMLGLPPAETRTLPSLETKSISPELIVQHYETWLHLLPTLSTSRQLDLLYNDSRLGRHFEAYTAAKAKLSDKTVDQVFAETFERLLTLSRSMAHEDLPTSLDSFSIVGSKFEGYAQLLAKQKPQAIAELIRLLEPYWGHNLGRSQLGKAAHLAGLQAEARRILEKQFAVGDQSIYSGTDSRILAQIWHADGKVAEAKELLKKAIEQVRQDQSDATHEDYPAEYIQELKQDLAENLQAYEQLFGEQVDSVDLR